MTRKLLLCSAAAILAAAFTSAAASAATPAPNVDLTKITAEAPVRDAIVTTTPARAAAAVESQTFTDSQGRAFTIDSYVPGYDLSKPAGVLNSTYHHDEITRIVIHVVRLRDMRSLCGDSQALACYRPGSGGKGELWYAADDSDWVHSLVHEYGHHVDNQYANISQLRGYGLSAGCGIDADGTRNWYFKRLNTNKMFNTFSCQASDWEKLLPELFAEDFVVLNGIHGWQLSTARPPTAGQAGAIRYDMDNAIFTESDSFSASIARRHSYTATFSTPSYNYLRVRVSGGSRTRYDVYVYRGDSSRYWWRAIGRRSSTTYLDYVTPGSWKIRVIARGRSGTANINVKVL